MIRPDSLSLCLNKVLCAYRLNCDFFSISLVVLQARLDQKHIQAFKKLHRLRGMKQDASLSCVCPGLFIGDSLLSCLTSSWQSICEPFPLLGCKTQHSSSMSRRSSHNWLALGTLHRIILRKQLRPSIKAQINVTTLSTLVTCDSKQASRKYSLVSSLLSVSDLYSQACCPNRTLYKSRDIHSAVHHKKSNLVEFTLSLLRIWTIQPVIEEQKYEIEITDIAGSMGAAHNLEALKLAGVTHVLNASPLVPCFYRKEFTYMVASVHDDPKEDLSVFFTDTNAFIQEVSHMEIL